MLRKRLVIDWRCYCLGAAFFLLFAEKICGGGGGWILGLFVRFFEGVLEKVVGC